MVPFILVVFHPLFALCHSCVFHGGWLSMGHAPVPRSLLGAPAERTPSGFQPPALATPFYQPEANRAPRTYDAAGMNPAPRSLFLRLQWHSSRRNGALHTCPYISILGSCSCCTCKPVIYETPYVRTNRSLSLFQGVTSASCAVRCGAPRGAWESMYVPLWGGLHALGSTLDPLALLERVACSPCLLVPEWGYWDQAFRRRVHAHAHSNREAQDRR